MKPERPSADAEFPPLTKRQVAELKRRMADSMDPRRFVIVTPRSPNFSLFYFPAEGVFAMNEIPDVSLFKRRAEGYRLESTTSVGGPWSEATEPVNSDGTWRIATIGPNGGATSLRIRATHLHIR